MKMVMTKDFCELSKQEMMMVDGVGMAING